MKTMKFFDKIDSLLTDEDSKFFLTQNLNLFKDNLIEAEKKIAKNIITIILLIALAELIHSRIITEISFSGVKIDKLGLVLLVLPCLISYFTYSLFNKIILRNLYNKLISKIVKHQYPKIAESDIDDLLVTNLESNTEDIITKGAGHFLSISINLLSAPFILFFQYFPFIYCFLILMDLYNYKDLYTTKAYVTSIVLSSIFAVRSILLIAAWINNYGFKTLITEVILDSIKLFSKHQKDNV